MNTVFLVKQVSDTWAKRRRQAEDGTLDRDAANALINELDYARLTLGLPTPSAPG